MEQRVRTMENLGMSFWNNRNVFVTGASGLLGAVLVEQLIRDGALVTCLLRDWVPQSRLITHEATSRIKVVRGELEDYLLLLRALNEHEIDTVFHLGAQTIVGTASRSPLSTFESNIRGTYNLLEACRECSRLVQRVVVASSDKAYGSQEHLPYTEEMPPIGRFPYDVSKSCADLISLSYFHTYGLPVAVTRCGNLFGPGDLNNNRLIPGTIRSILRNEAPVIRSNGKFIRDYFFVRDAANAYLRLAERLPSPAITGEAFNFGTEEPMSVIDVVSIVLQLMNRQDLKPAILNQATHEIERQYLDCAKARRVLAWKPDYTFKEGLLETIEWYAEYAGATPLAALV